MKSGRLFESGRFVLLLLHNHESSVSVSEHLNSDPRKEISQVQSQQGLHDPLPQQLRKVHLRPVKHAIFHYLNSGKYPSLLQPAGAQEKEKKKGKTKIVPDLFLLLLPLLLATAGRPAAFPVLKLIRSRVPRASRARSRDLRESVKYRFLL